MCLGVCVFASACKKKSQKRRIRGDREEGEGGVSQSGCLVSLYDLAPGRKGRKKRLKNVCVCVPLRVPLFCCQSHNDTHTALKSTHT